MNQATADYIRMHADSDVRQLALQGSKDPEVDFTFALEQIAGRQKAKAKLPAWAATDGIIYPPHLSMEQCSSELTARYKAGVIASLPQIQHRRFVDLTGGFGVDFAWMARHFEQAMYVERQPQLCAISSINFDVLGLAAEVVNADCSDYLHTLDHADVIFLDPARRDEHGARTYGIADCTPDVLQLMDELTAKTECLILKLSPMLDWRKAVADIGGAREVHIVSANNECKELLLVVDSQQASPDVVCVNLLPDGSVQRFVYTGGQARCVMGNHTSCLTPCVNYLLEPNASVMKAGCFDLLAARYSIHQLDTNSHLFVSEADKPDFPGRRFCIEKAATMNKRELKEALAGIERANIAVRNFPLSVAELRKRLKLKDGGDLYIFATTVANEGHKLFICRKIS